jgi:PAS domain S-box-containing protein
MLLLTLATLCASAAGPTKRVLILNPFGRDVAPFNAAISAFRTTLARELGEPVDFYEVPLDLARIAESEGENPLVAFLEGRIKNHPVDLVVPIGGAGTQFAARHRERLFSDTPVLIVAAEPRLVPPDFLRTNATLVTQKINLPGMVEDILQLQPQTTNIVVVFGASPLEHFWVGECRREFQIFTNRVGFTWLNDLPLEQIVQRCAALPPHSFILHGLFVVDAAGVPCENDAALRRLHEVANAPLAGFFASEFGLGPIGGRLFQDSEIGTKAARTAIRILRGERPQNIPPEVLEAAAPVYDWRELQRWGISAARLPAGSSIQFRQPGFWELYRWWVTGVVAFCLLQTALVVALLLNRARRHQGEVEATLVADISSKFVNLPAREVDREIEAAQRSICGFLGLELSSLWQWSVVAPEILTLTHLYRLLDGPPTPASMSANEHFPWCERQFRAGRTIVLSSLDELSAETARDRETFRHYGIQSALIIPLSVAGEPPVGVLSFGSVRAERDWPDALVKRLQLVAQIFANALARKRADQVLRESEERFRLLIEQAPEAVVVFDPAQNRLVQANAQAERLFGYNREELLVSGPQRFYAPEQPDGRPVAESMPANNERVLRGETVLTERTICNALGQQLHCEVRLVRLPASESKLIRASFIDITERKQTEAALRDLSGRLINAHEEERARLARELHNDITQRLARLAIDAGSVGSRADGVSPAETMRSVRDGLVRLSEDIHALSYRLHPAVLEDLGLAEALKAECDRFSRQGAVPADVTLAELPSVVPSETALCLFRVTQEALRNVARHAKARTVKVSVRALDGGLQLAVNDDGAGFDPALQRDHPSLGLASMRERVRLVAGELDIESAPGQGTTILVWVPLKKAEG